VSIPIKCGNKHAVLEEFGCAETHVRPHPEQVLDVGTVEVCYAIKHEQENILHSPPFYGITKQTTLHDKNICFAIPVRKGYSFSANNENAAYGLRNIRLSASASRCSIYLYKALTIKTKKLTSV
jgi:hypothetical protein